MANDKRVLYAYFGNLGIFSEDIPGHSFYQIGLLDAIREREGDDCKFDFYSYLPVPEPQEKIFPDDAIGQLNDRYMKELIAEYRLSYKSVIDNIRNGRYSAIYLKARFRNLSTLAKGFNDAYQFEAFIKEAADVPDLKVYVLDTDLSLSDEFLESAAEYGVKRIVPSIDMPGVGSGFMKDVLEIHATKGLSKTKNQIMYYGNLDFKNYKAGHEKNPIIFDLINKLHSYRKFNKDGFSVIHAGKPTEDISVSRTIHRKNRAEIWQEFKFSVASINISKDLYVDKGFLPARVYEAAMFGTVTVSFMDKTLHPSFGFTTVEEAIEQLTYLSEIHYHDYLTVLESQATHILLRGRHTNK